MALSDWDSKAQETFGKIMEVVPEPMREGMQPQLIGMIEGKAAGAPVTDEVIERLVREDMPEPQKSVIMGALGMSEDAPKAAEAEAAEAERQLVREKYATIQTAMDAATTPDELKELLP